MLSGCNYYFLYKIAMKKNIYAVILLEFDWLLLRSVHCAFHF